MASSYSVTVARCPYAVFLVNLRKADQRKRNESVSLANQELGDGAAVQVCSV